jgi:hypothetical protein
LLSFGIELEEGVHVQSLILDGALV